MVKETVIKFPGIKFPAKKYKKFWNPLYKDSKSWLFGFFKPKARCEKDLPYLEKHKYPELFLLTEGKIVLVLRKTEKSPKTRMVLKKGEAVILDCWHNGYALEPNSAALIIERPVNPTKTIKN